MEQPSQKRSRENQFLDHFRKAQEEYRSAIEGMALSISEEDARDLEFQRAIQEAFDTFQDAAGDEWPTAKSRHLNLLRAFSTRVLGREPRIAEM